MVGKETSLEKKSEEEGENSNACTNQFSLRHRGGEELKLDSMLLHAFWCFQNLLEYHS